MRGLARLACLVSLAFLAAGTAEARRQAAPPRPARIKQRPRVRPKPQRLARTRSPLAAARKRPAARPHRRPAELADLAIARARQLGLEGDEAIDAAVERLMDEAKDHGIEVSLSVGSLGGRNRNITSRFAFNQLDPAGNLALVTAAYALDALGPGHRFETGFATDPGGNLYVDGAGLDPSLDRRALDAIAGSLRAAGVRRVSGDLVLAGAPSGDLARRLRSSLAGAGIEVAGAVRTGRAPSGATTRHVHRSASLAAITRRSLAGEPIDQEALARAANAVQRTGKPIESGAAGVARFLGARVRLRTFNREFALRDLSAGGNTLSSDQMLAVLRYARGHQRTAPLLDALASSDGRVFAATSRDGAAVARSGFIRARGRKADLGFAALARARTPAEQPVAQAWLDALAITLARLEPRAARPRPAPPSSWPAVPRGALELETTFGRPGEYVVRHRLPIGPGGRMAQVRINRKLIPVLEAALAEAAGRDLVKHIARFGGTFKLRTKRRPDGTELQPPMFSTHSYGVSFDLNPDREGGSVHPELGALFEKYGFVWGKYFQHNYDPMHFQFVADY